MNWKNLKIFKSKSFRLFVISANKAFASDFGVSNLPYL